MAGLGPEASVAMADDSVRALGAMLFWVALLRFVTVIVAVIVPPVPSDDGVAASDTSSDFRLHVGTDVGWPYPPVVQAPATPAWLVSASVVTSADVPDAVTSTPKTSDWPGRMPLGQVVVSVSWKSISIRFPWTLKIPVTTQPAGG